MLASVPHFNLAIQLEKKLRSEYDISCNSIMLVTKTSSVRECTSLYNIITQHKHYMRNSLSLFFSYSVFLYKIWRWRDFFLSCYWKIEKKRKRPITPRSRRIVSRRSPTHDFLHNIIIMSDTYFSYSYLTPKKKILL